MPRDVLKKKKKKNIATYSGLDLRCNTKALGRRSASVYSVMSLFAIG